MNPHKMSGILYTGQYTRIYSKIFYEWINDISRLSCWAVQRFIKQTGFCTLVPSSIVQGSRSSYSYPMEGESSTGGGVWVNPLPSGGSQNQTHFPGFANPCARGITNGSPMTHFRSSAMFHRKYGLMPVKDTFR